MPLTDEIIREKARAFAATTSNPEKYDFLSSAWLKKFKERSNLLGARSRKGSLAPNDTDYTSAAASPSHTPKSGTSPVSPIVIGSPKLHSAQSQESLRNESPESYIDYERHPFHSEGTNSLHSINPAAAPSSFSPLGPLSPTSLTSPFFISDSGVTARSILPASIATNSQRPRSQTFPLLDQCMSGPETATPKHLPSSMLDSPMEEASDPLLSLNDAVNATQPDEQPKTVSPKDMTMRPPPLPSHVKREEIPAILDQTTSPEEARRALRVLMDFMEQEQSSFDKGDFLQVGKLMGKLGVRSQINGRTSNPIQFIPHCMYC